MDSFSWLHVWGYARTRKLNLELRKKIDPLNICTLRYNVYYVSDTESKLQ